ncbi:MAG: hypothetical protein AB1813_04580 [Verrucomicrobiota bacterium]
MSAYPEHVETEALNVVIAYEDYECGQRARHLLERIEAKVTPDFHLNHVMWKFELLAVPALRRLATEDVLMADIILIAARENADLPPLVKDWVSAWPIAGSKKRRALVAILDVPEVPTFESSGVCAYLAGVARKDTLDFFCQPVLGTNRCGNPAHG